MVKAPPKLASVSKANASKKGILRSFLSILRKILEKSYTDGIDRILTLDVRSPLKIQGSFVDGSKHVGFTITTKTITTHLLSESKHDARKPTGRRSRKQCQVGLSCGGTCISRHKKCSLNISRLGVARDVRNLQLMSHRLNTPGAEGSAAPSTKDPLEDKSIRELRKEAQKRGVYRYSNMNKEQLKGAIRAADESPEQQERVRKTLGRRKQARRTVGGSAVGEYAKDWKTLKKLIALAGISPVAGVAITGIWLRDRAAKKFQEYKSDYKSGLDESAKLAQDRAEKLPAHRVYKPNMTFAVGGYEAEGANGDDVKKGLEDEANKENAGDREKWFKEQHEVIAVNLKHSDIPPFDGEKKNEKGQYTRAYVGYLVRSNLAKHFGRTSVIGNAVASLTGRSNKARNEDSVNLAAEIYAMARHREERTESLQEKTVGELKEEAIERGIDTTQLKTRDQLTGAIIGHRSGREEAVNKGRAINIVAYGGGGLAVKEALEILSRMRPEGEEISKRINTVYIGTPDFGITDPIGKETTLKGTGDGLISTLPSRKNQPVQDVNGHELDEYMKNPEAMRAIQTHLGYERWSAYTHERRPVKKAPRKTRKEKESDILEQAIAGEDKAALESLARKRRMRGLENEALRKLPADQYGRLFSEKDDLVSQARGLGIQNADKLGKVKLLLAILSAEKKKEKPKSAKDKKKPESKKKGKTDSLIYSISFDAAIRRKVGR